MQRRVIASVFLLALGLGTAPAGADVLPFQGTLTVDNLRVNHPLEVTGAGVATALGGSGFALPGSVLATTGLTAPLTDPQVYPLLGLQLTVQVGAGSVSGGSGTIPLSGLARICLFAACNAAPAGNLSVPLSPVGVGGTATVQGDVDVTVIGAPWTTGTATVAPSQFPGFTFTAMGFAHGPASATASAIGPSGVVGLVSPVLILTNVAAGTDSVFPTFAYLTLQFVPEPGTFALLALSLVGLGFARQRRHAMRRADGAD